MLMKESESEKNDTYDYTISITGFDFTSKYNTQILLKGFEPFTHLPEEFLI